MNLDDPLSGTRSGSSAAKRLLWLGFVVGLFAAMLGLATSLAAALVGGGWYLAPEPWIGIGLTLLIVGLAPIHLASPVLIVASLRRSLGLGAILLAVLFIAAAIGLVIIAGPNVPLPIYGVLLGAWIVTAAFVMVTGRRPLGPIPSAIAVSLTTTALVLVVLWWLIAPSGLMFGDPAARSVDTLRIVIYSFPDLALVLPGLPTLALVVMTIAGAFGSKRQPQSPAALELSSEGEFVR